MTASLVSPLLLVTLLTLLCLVGLLVAESRRWTAGMWVFKPLASLGFIAAALLSGALGSSYGQLVLAGLCLSWVGDQLLIPKDSLAAFRGGLVSFLLGHVAYAAAFASLGPRPLWTVVAAIPALTAAVGVMRWLNTRTTLGRMYVPVLAYVAVISLMVVLAVGTAALDGGPIRLAGAVAFYLSDLAVARDRFVSPGFKNRLWGLPLYYGGQVMIACSCASV